MRKIRSFFKWLLADTFPFSLFPLFLFIHIMVLILYPDARATINKYVSNILQFIGLIIVLKAVNDNVKIIDRGSITRSISEWLNAFPFRKRKATVHVVNIAGELNSAGHITARLIHKPETLEEKINYAFEELKRLEREISHTTETRNKKINGLEATIGELKTKQDNKIQDIQMRLSEVFAGGAKEEIFGVVCIFYSLVTSFFS